MLDDRYTRMDAACAALQALLKESYAETKRTGKRQFWFDLRKSIKKLSVDAFKREVRLDVLSRKKGAKR